MPLPSLNQQGQIQPCSPEQLATTKLQIARHLLCKRWLLLITNICNLSCGGCNEMCGLFAKDQLWYLPFPEIDRSQQEVQNPTLVTETNLQGIGKPQLVQLTLPEQVKRNTGA